MLRYKGVLYMTGTDRKMIFQGVHMLMAADLGNPWGDTKPSTKWYLSAAASQRRRLCKAWKLAWLNQT